MTPRVKVNARVELGFLQQSDWDYYGPPESTWGHGQMWQLVTGLTPPEIKALLIRFPMDFSLKCSGEVDQCAYHRDHRVAPRVSLRLSHLIRAFIAAGTDRALPAWLDQITFAPGEPGTPS